MKYCKKCGAELNDDSLFCKKCGAKYEDSAQNTSAFSAQKTQNASSSNSGSSKGAIIGVVIGIIVIIIVIILIGNSNAQSYSSNTYNTYDSYDIAADDVYEPETTAIVQETQAQTEPATVKETEPAVEEYEYCEDDGYGDSSEYMLYGSDEWYISDSDLRGFGPWECKVARNEIYARHGRLFKDSELQRYFDSKSWYYGYISPDSFDESVFSAVEKANITTIKNYENSMGW